MIEPEHQAYLIAMATSSLAFAGFGGVVFALPRRSGKWNERDTAGMRFMLMPLVVACFLALLPFPIAAMTPESVWDASGVVATGLVAWLVFAEARKADQLIETGYPPRMLKRFTSLLVMLLLLSIWEAMSVFRGENPQGPYFWILLALLFTAAGQFYVFIMRWQVE